MFVLQEIQKKIDGCFMTVWPIESVRKHINKTRIICYTIDDMYNIPCVTDVTGLLQKWVYNPASHQRLLNATKKEIPEVVRRFTGDIYMCVYINPILDLYAKNAT